MDPKKTVTIKRINSYGQLETLEIDVGSVRYVYKVTYTRPQPPRYRFRFDDETKDTTDD